MRVGKNVNNNQYFGNSFVGDEIRITLKVKNNIKYGLTNFFFLKEKDVKMQKKIISTSKWYAKHLFTG